MTLRVASYNIRTARAPDRRSFWWRRRGALARAIRDVDADVWALQEVFALQRRYLEADVLAGHAWVGSGRTRSRAGEGLFVAARRERVAVEGSDVRWFGDQPDRPGSKLPGAGFPRIAVLASLRVDDRPLLVVDVHLDERSSDRRAASVRQLAAWVGEEADGRTVAVLGDFNEETPSAIFDPLRELGLAPALGPDHGGSSHSFGREEPRQIDNVWLSPDARVEAARVGTEAAMASDHDPVVVDLTLA
ncbi:MAG: endonuclease/exonuclease/phosphatase family protein [Acidimicrobiales bacterium]|nr:endonuclease/exonuclease/phosphatase family protein [Acidimicrobiales bacterium]HRW39318.1 endonuclease/exonuclease/phosphatase family protein [Aquihabitans sp.]